jgi:hypothetical protein
MFAFGAKVTRRLRGPIPFDPSLQRSNAMSRKLRNLVLSGLTFGLLVGAASAPNVMAQKYAPRQYYSDWHEAPDGDYHYRKYYYKPTPDYAGYRVHEVHHFKEKPDHCYFWNKKTKKYWGRCPTECDGKPQYSLLKMEDRHADLNKIPESKFPPPGKMPPIPDSDPKEGATLDLPPEDTPAFPVK